MHFQLWFSLAALLAYTGNFKNVIWILIGHHSCAIITLEYWVLNTCFMTHISKHLWKVKIVHCWCILIHSLYSTWFLDINASTYIPFTTHLSHCGWSILMVMICWNFHMHLSIWENISLLRYSFHTVYTFLDKLFQVKVLHYYFGII